MSCTHLFVPLQLFTNQKEKMKRLMASLLLGLIVLTVQGQMVDPVHFSTQLNMLKGDEGEIVFSATIDEGWHVYSTDLGNGGPISATFNAVKMEGVETVGKLKPRGHVIKQYDKLFDMEVLFFEKTAQFVQRVRFTHQKYSIDCYLEYGACNDEMCMPPTEVAFKASSNLPLKGEAIEAAEKGKQPDPLVKKEETQEVAADTVALIEIPTEDTTAVDSAIVDSATVTPLPLEGMGEAFSLWYILLMGFVGGLLAVLMPCIWPIIPMTVSFFLKRAKTDRRKGIRDALTYGASIIVIYLGLGLLVTALFGSDALYIPIYIINSLCPLVLRLVRNPVARFMGECCRYEGYSHQRTAVHLPHGFHAGLGVVLLYSTHHRTAARRDRHQRQLAGSRTGHAGLCRGPGTALHTLRPVPLVA